MKLFRQIANKFINSSIEFKLLLLSIIVFVPIVFFYIVNFNQYQNQIKENVEELNENFVSYNLLLVDEMIFNIEQDLYYANAVNSEFRNFIFTENHTVQSINSVLNLQSVLRENVTKNNFADGFFMVDPDNDFYLDATNDDYEYNAMDSLRQMIKKRAIETKNSEEKSSKYLWFYYKGEEESFIIKYIPSGDIYVGAYINCDKILDMINLDSTDMVSFLLAKDDTVIQTSDDVYYEDALVQVGSDYYYEDDKQNYIGYKTGFLRGEFSIVVMTTYSVISNAVKFHYIMLFAFFGFLVVSAIFIWQYYKRFIINPIYILKEGMDKLKFGEKNHIIEKTGNGLVFDDLISSFNSMSKEIHNLKINVYEEKLNKQHALLKFYRSQINPHFLINALNTIYNHSQIQNTAYVKDMSFFLSSYLRYTIQNSDKAVTVEHEIKQAENYIKVQQLRFPNMLLLNVDVDEDIMQFKLPVLILNTFLENCMKYAMCHEKKTIININISKHQKSKMKISIEDNGAGFNEEMLEKLNSAYYVQSEQDKIGICNILQRLNLLYKSDYSAKFYNKTQGGAVVELILPITDEALNLL